MKVKFRIGKAGLLSEYNGSFRVTPAIESNWNTCKFDDEHNLSFSLMWIFYGFGIQFRWKNKHKMELPDLDLNAII